MAGSSNRDVSNKVSGSQPTQESIIQNQKELELIEAAKQGDENAKADLLSIYSGMIHKIVINHQRGSFPYDAYPDMFNEGAFYFFRAVQLYDVTKGASLGTYAYMWIQQGIKRHVYRHSGHMNLPPEKCRLAAKVLKLLADGYTHSEVAKQLDITPSAMDSILRAKLTMATLEGTVAEESQALIDSIAGSDDVESDAINDMLSEALYRWVDKLEPEEITLLSLRYGLNGNCNHTFEEIATIMNPASISSDPEAKALKKGRVITLVERAEQKLQKIAMREQASARGLSSTSMFSQPVNSKKDKDMDMDFESDLGPTVSG
jgi:RNA polymerase primary sigma factor